MHTLMHGLGIASFGCSSGQSDLWFHRIALRIDIQIYPLLSLHIVVKCDDGHSLVNSPKRTFVLMSVILKRRVLLIPMLPLLLY